MESDRKKDMKEKISKFSNKTSFLLSEIWYITHNRKANNYVSVFLKKKVKKPVRKRSKNHVSGFGFLDLRHVDDLGSVWGRGFVSHLLLLVPIPHEVRLRIGQFGSKLESASWRNCRHVLQNGVGDFCCRCGCGWSAFNGVGETHPGVTSYGRKTFLLHD